MEHDCRLFHLRSEARYHKRGGEWGETGCRGMPEEYQRQRQMTVDQCAHLESRRVVGQIARSSETKTRYVSIPSKET